MNLVDRLVVLVLKFVRETRWVAKQGRRTTRLMGGSLALRRNLSREYGLVAMSAPFTFRTGIRVRGHVQRCRSGICLCRRYTAATKDMVSRSLRDLMESLSRNV